MGGKTRAMSSGCPGISSTPPQHMYLLEGDLLVVSNLLKTDAWVHDAERSHCNVCVQQFMPFRRRHHCRTCGEVVCGHCSSQRKIHLTEVNVECATRVCSFCMIRATDAAITHAARESVAIFSSGGIGEYAVARLTTPQHTSGHLRSHAAPHGLPPSHPASKQPPPPQAGRAIHQHTRGRPRVTKKMSMLSLESDLTDGSVVQLWPPVPADNETERLEIARNSTIRNTESDPTMALLVSIVARTLECPVAYIGILEDTHLWFKATVGWDRTHIPRDDCVCAMQEKTMIVADTNQDKHFYANTLTVGPQPMRYYAGAPIRVLGQCIGAVSAIDINPHKNTTASMKSTLEAVANIVSEVLEQRVDSTRRSMDIIGPGIAPSEERPRAPLISSPVKLTLFPKTQSTSSCSSESTFVDFNDAAMRDLRAIGDLDLVSIDSDGDSFEEEDVTISARRQRPASETVIPESASAVHPWPSMGGRMSSGMFGGAAMVSHHTLPRFSLAVPMGPPEVSEKINQAMEFFQALQSSRWSATQNNSPDDELLSFELVSQGRHFTKSHATLTGDCTHVIARLQTYDDARLYPDLIEQVTQRRQKINVQTWIDHVQLRPGFESSHFSEVKVLSHWRQYPDGSNVIVALNDTNPELLMVEDFLFGWFISPGAIDEHGNCTVNVSSLVAQPIAVDQNQHQDDFNISMLFLRRLKHTLPHHYHVGMSMMSMDSDESRSTSSCSSSDNQRSNNRVVPVMPAGFTPDSMALMGRRPRSATGGDRMVTIQSRYGDGTGSCLNANEQMLLDLLDKTISTQEVLAAQQHVMANVMDYHGTQLQRISSAIERVETMLNNNGDKLRQINSLRGRSTQDVMSGRHSTAL